MQYRNKNFDPGRDLPELKAIVALANIQGRLLIVNDDVELAMKVGAGGVHLGKGDGSIVAARSLMGPEAMIGATVHSLEELFAVKGKGADYYGVGPVFGTSSKDTGLPDLGLEGLAELVAAADKPVIAIGRIGLENAESVIGQGAHGIAVISAYCMSDNPPVVAHALLDILQRSPA